MKNKDQKQTLSFEMKDKGSGRETNPREEQTEIGRALSASPVATAAEKGS